MCLDNNADAKRILLASAPADWRKQLGRRGITWLSTIQQDLKHHHLTLPEAADLAQNRPLWRMMSTYGATQLWVSRQKRRQRQYCVHMVGNKQMNGCIDERTCWEHYATTCQSGLTEAQTFWTFGMTVSGGMIGTKLWDTVISLKGHKAALVWLLHPSISVVPHGIIIHWEQRIYFLAATCSLWLECATTEETYMLRLILQILVLVCSSLDQHGDLPGSCRLLMLPKLCAVVSSLQTHPEPVAAELPWYDLQCIQLHIIEHHG